MIIGILAVHGSREEHDHMLQKLNAEVRFVRNTKDLENLDGIIFPGGESTSFGRLLEWSDLRKPLEEKILTGKLPAFGTCAGAILLASKGSEFCFGAIDMTIDRNAYGRQIDSFSEEISMPNILIEPFHSVFIRAPKITHVGENAKTLVSYSQNPILVQSTVLPVLAATFHPELTEDTRIHQYFLDTLCKPTVL